MNKLATLRQSFATTEIIEGSRTSYFITFWLTKVFSLLQRQSALLDTVIHSIVSHLPTLRFIIKNKTGVFAVEAFDDSTTICSDYFEAEIRDWLATPTTKDICIDIGANRGLYAIIAPTIYGYQKVHAFEPNPEVVTILQKNIDLNHLEKYVTVHPVALGSTSGTVNFSCDPLHKGGGRITSGTEPHETSVPVSVFDIEMSSLDARRISLVKIDTEGFEFHVLMGMEKTLAQMIPGSCIMVESNDVAQVTILLSKSNFSHRTSSNSDHLFIKNS